MVTLLAATTVTGDPAASTRRSKAKSPLIDAIPVRARVPPTTSSRRYGPAGSPRAGAGAVLTATQKVPPSVNPAPPATVTAVDSRPVTPAEVSTSWPLVAPRVSGPRVSSGLLPTLAIEAVTTPAPVWVKVTAARSVCPARVTWTSRLPTTRCRVAARVSTSTVSGALIPTPGTAKATVPVNLPAAPAGDRLSVSEGPVTVSRPPASKSEALLTDTSVPVPLRATETSPVRR